MVMPILLILLLAVSDLLRVYTTMATVESAAREAADFGSFNSSNWIGSLSDPESNYSKTVDGMTERACSASSHLPDFVGSGTECTNPAISISLTEIDGSPAIDCADAERIPGPCLVQVDLDYLFNLLVPVGMDFYNVRLRLPQSFAFRIASVYANSDYELDQ